MPPERAAVPLPDNDTRTNLALLLADEQAFSLPKSPLPLPFAIEDLLNPTQAEPAPPCRILLALAAGLGIEQNTTQAALERAAGWSEGRCISNNPVAGSLPAGAGRHPGAGCRRAQPAGPPAAGHAGPVRPADRNGAGGQGHAAVGRRPGLCRLSGRQPTLLSGEFAQADALFAALAGQDQPWLKETADYMRIRVALNQSQQSAFDDWGTLDRNQIDQAAVQRAEQFIADYRSRYPEGRYLDSANGLLRRLAWFKGTKRRWPACSSRRAASRATRSCSTK